MPSASAASDILFLRHPAVPKAERHAQNSSGTAGYFLGAYTRASCIQYAG